MSGAAHVTRRRPCVCCVTEIAADCVMTSVAVPCDRTRYPAAFGSREHLLYIGHNLAVHAVSWGFVFVWTTFFGLLRDHKSVDEFIVWGIGATLFTGWLLVWPRMADPRRIVRLLGVWVGLATIASIAILLTQSLLMVKILCWIFIPSIYFYIGPCFGMLNNLALPRMRAMFCAATLFVANVGKIPLI